MCQALRELLKDEFIETEERGLERGLEQGLKQGLEQGLEQGINAFIQGNIKENISTKDILKKLVAWFNLSEDKALEYYTKFSQ